MNWSPILGGAIGGLVIALIGYALAYGRPQVDTQSGRAIVFYSPILRAVGIVLAVFLASATVHVSWRQPDDRDVQLLLAGFTVLGGGYMLLEFFGVWIEFDSESVCRVAPWHRDRVAPWTEVVRVSYSPWASWHVLHTERSGQIRVPEWMSGASHLVEYARKRVEANKRLQATRSKQRAPEA